MSALGIQYNTHKVISSLQAPLTAINALSTAAGPSVESATISSLPQPPRINLKHLRTERYTHKGASRGPFRGRYGNLQLPKVYKLICIPENGLGGLPLMPKKSSPVYTDMERHNMIVDVTFNEGDLSYCRQQVLQTFAHLPLPSFQFYRALGNSRNLTPATTYNWENFDLTVLQEYVLS